MNKKIGNYIIDNGSKHQNKGKINIIDLANSFCYDTFTNYTRSQFRYVKNAMYEIIKRDFNFMEVKK